MKKIIYILILIAFIVGGYYLYTNNRVVEKITETHITYSQSDIGLEFDYSEGPDGYVIDERMPVDLDSEFIKNIILTRTEDALREPPVAGEGSPVILISVFKNTKKQFPRTWADENIEYSNINLIVGEVNEAVVGGANAIRYMADGLYMSENVVVAHGDHVYVITGQFMDQDSPIRLDYQKLVESIRFIPTPDQIANTPDEPIGGQRDKDGCLNPAGYTFSKEVGACLREFEMTPDIINAARIAVEHVGSGYALTVVSFNSYEELGAYDIMLERGIEREATTVLIRNWKVDSVITQ